ncbi:MAG: EAL domain-containing protein, partial [Gemmatimonadota bacterium]
INHPMTPMQAWSQLIEPLHLLPLCVGAGMLVLGVAVVAYEHGTRESRAFFLLTAALAVWMLGFAGMYAAPDDASALRWARLAYIGVPAIAPAVYTFSVHVLRIAEARRGWIIASWATAALFIALAVAPTPFVVDVVHYDWGVYPRLGWLGAVYLAWFIALLVGTITEYVRALRYAERGTRYDRRVRWLLGAFAIGYIALVDYLPALGIDIYPFGYLPILVFLVISAWTIGRYHLVDLATAVTAEKIIETMSDPLVVCDREARIRIVNRAVEAVLRRPPGTLIGESVGRLAGGREAEAARLEALAHDPPREGEEAVFEDAAGEPVAVSITAARLTAQDDGELGTVLIARDIRERKRAERRLAESEQRYRSLFQYNPDAVYSFDLSGRFLTANPACETISGYTRDQLLATGWMKLVVPEHRTRAWRMFQRVLEGEPQHYELAIRHREGHRVELSGASIPVVVDDEIVGLYGVATDVTQRKRAEEELRHSAYHDPLTGIPNRAAFMEHLGRAVQRAQQRTDYGFAVLFLDLDRFKIINDSLGHGVGDEMLVQLARRLGVSLRPEDRVARLGGDEFGILLFNVQEVAEATRIAERIKQQLERPFVIEGNEVYTTASIGIALSATGYRRPEDVLRDADIAMYRAKEHGESRFEVFDEVMHRQAVTLLELETDLRRAIAREEFRLLFQPIVALETGAPVGFEALLRWIHPERGTLVPADFIGLAEETGLIIPIGSWVLREACRIAASWEAAEARSAPFVSVNIAARQLVRPGFVREVDDTLAESGLANQRLVLEVTERGLLDNPDVAAKVLEQLRERRIRVAVDDFGTGYSSLGYLNRLPLDGVKIDRSFVQYMGGGGTEQLVLAIIALARGLGLDVSAEGVETEAQRADLDRLGCRTVQGFLFAQPLAPEEAARWTASRA